jgi:hypothetical protein
MIGTAISVTTKILPAEENATAVITNEIQPAELITAVRL